MASTAAELSSLRTKLVELSDRVTELAERYRGSPDSQVASHLFAAERALHSARLGLERASDSLTD